MGGRADVLERASRSFVEEVWFYLGFPLKKLDSHRFSGLASQCVEWFDLNIERTNREAPSPSFLQEKIKTLEITWRR